MTALPATPAPASRALDARVSLASAPAGRAVGAAARPDTTEHPQDARAGWVPVSPCSALCLPPAGRPGPVGAARLLGLVAVLAGALAGAVALPAAARGRWTRRCATTGLRVLGVRLEVRGRRPDPGASVLLVANHRSWIDVLALHAVAPVRLLAKREVAAWPVIGPFAARAGTLFVDRHGLRSLPATVAATADALRSGAAVAAFPEGTTWCGAAAGIFRPAPFQAALDAGVAVVPVAVVLDTRDGSFVGDDTLWQSVRRVVARPGLRVVVTVLPPVAGTDRRALAAAAAGAVARVTGVPHGPAARSRPAVDDPVAAA